MPTLPPLEQKAGFLQKQWLGRSNYHINIALNKILMGQQP